MYIYIYIHIEGINKHTRIRIGLEDKDIYSGLVGISMENERKKTETYIVDEQVHGVESSPCRASSAALWS